MAENAEKNTSARLAEGSAIQDGTQNHQWTAFHDRHTELTLTCTCGFVWKNIPFGPRTSVLIPVCPMATAI